MSFLDSKVIIALAAALIGIVLIVIPEPITTVSGLGICVSAGVFLVGKAAFSFKSD